MNEDPHIPDTSDRSSWIEHLSTLYQLEFGTLNIGSTIAAAAMSLTLGFLYNLPPHCPDVSDGKCLRDVDFLALPMAPLVVLLFYTYLFLNGRVVGKYARALERAMGEQWGQTVSYPALSRLSGALFGGEVRRLASLRLIYVLLAGAIFGVSVFTGVWLIGNIERPELRAAGAIFYGGAVLLLFVSFSVAASHQTWNDLHQAVKVRDKQTTLPFADYRSWLSYLGFVVVPRPASLLKGLDSFLVIGIALLVGLPATRPWSVVAIGVLLFDLVLYQTRYYMNGMREDPEISPLPANKRNDSEQRAAPLQRALAPAVIAVRLGAFVFLSSLFLSVETAVRVLLLFLTAYFAYELPREFWRRKLSDLVRRGRIQEDGYKVIRRAAVHPTVVVLFVTAGAGYGLRAGFALHLLAPELPASVFGICVVASVWAAGSAQAAVGWVVEMQGAISRHLPVVHPGIIAKPHLFWAASQLRPDPPSLLGYVPLEESRVKERVDSWAARSALPPWDAALIVSVGALLVAAVTIGPPMWARAALALVVLAYLTSRAVQMAENPEEAQNRNWALAGEPTVRLRSKQLQIPIPAWIWVVALAGGIVALGPAWGTPVGFGFAVFWALVRVEPELAHSFSA